MYEYPNRNPYNYQPLQRVLISEKVTKYYENGELIMEEIEREYGPAPAPQPYTYTSGGFVTKEQAGNVVNEALDKLNESGVE